MQEARRRDAAAEIMSLSEYPVTVKARDRLVDRYIEAVGSDSYITGRKRAALLSGQRRAPANARGCPHLA